MPSLKGEGIGTGQPGEPLRGVGSEGQDAFVGIDHLIAAIDGKRNHGNGARGWARGGWPWPESTICNRHARVKGSWGGAGGGGGGGGGASGPGGRATTVGAEA